MLFPKELILALKDYIYPLQLVLLVVSVFELRGRQGRPAGPLVDGGSLVHAPLDGCEVHVMNVRRETALRA